MTADNKDRNAGAGNRDAGKSQGPSGTQPAKGGSKGASSKKPTPRTSPVSPRGGSDEDEDAGERTAPGKPKEFDESTHRKRGEPTVEGDTDSDTDIDADDEE